MMTHKQSIDTVQLNLEANTIVPFVLSYNFDYSQFDKPELQNKAKSTLSNFLGFVRSSFDGLLSIGQALQNFYFECLQECSNGKKVFSDWLNSDDFGATKHFATSAMSIWTWYEKLPLKVQRLVRQNVQKWSVSALRQLTKVSTDLVKELVSTGKKTAQQVKKSGGGEVHDSGELVAKQSLQNALSQLDSSTPPLTHSPTPLAPGVRVIVAHDKMWAGYSGIIMSQQADSFWVLLDNRVAQRMEVKNLFKENQLQPEAKQATNSIASKELFTLEQVEEKIASALAQRDREEAEKKQGQYIEIRDAARQEVKRELIAAEQYASSMAQAKQALLEQLAATQQELQSVRALQIRNQQLEQRVTELEKALEGASANRWNNTFTNQAAKVINSDLEKTIAPLSAEVERLQNLVKSKEQELLELQTQNEKQQEELVMLQQSSVQVSENILTEFGEIGEQLGWAGWSRRGYRAASGMLHTGINAIAAFVADLSSQLSYQEEMTF